MDQNRSRLKNVAITYDNDSLMDGAGSQLYRIYATYAISRLLNISYYHSPIKRIGYQGVISLEKNEEDLELPKRYNKKFHIPSDVEIPPDANITALVFDDQKILSELTEKARQNPTQFFLIKIAVTKHLLYRQPSALEYARAISPFKKRDSSLLRVAIHVRWGDLPIGYSRRLLPNEYYIAVTTKIVEALKRWNIAYVCELYTELPPKPFTVTPDHYGVEGRLKESMILNPEQHNITDFDIIPDLKKFINADPIETLEGLATSDLLVMSRSSFSALGAVLNQTGTAVYIPFYHPPMPGWLQHFPSILFDEQLERFCKAWIRERQRS